MARRSQWLTDRRILSNWRTDTENEARQKVSLSRATEPLAQSPLLMGLGEGVIGLTPFGGELVVLSQVTKTEWSIDENVSLYQLPLLLPPIVDCIGHLVFAGELIAENRYSGGFVEDLLDTLATEDFEPVVEPNDMDEIALG